MSGTMIEDRGAEYVAAWPAMTTRDLGMGLDYILDAIRAVVPGATISWEDLHTGEPLPSIGALTVEQARAVVAELLAIKRRLRERERTHCRGCGLPLVRGRCQECV